MKKRFDVYIDIGGLSFEVSGRYTAAQPAILTGHPDTWRPAESSELLVQDVRLLDGREVNVDNEKFEASWGEKIIEAILAA